MKKLVPAPMLALLLCWFFTSCKETSPKTEEVQDNVEEVGNVDNEILEASEDLTSEVPSFGNPAVQDYVDSYEAYLEEYSKAVETKDINALSNLGPKGKELAVKAQEISGNMSVEDAQKFTHYMTEKAKLIQDLTSKIAE